MSSHAPGKYLILLSFLLLFSPATATAEETILQYFNTSWHEIERRLPEVAEAGYTSLWLPPPFKGASGTYSVGFDTHDRFDLGDIDQSGTIRTKYGTKAELLSLIRIAHRFGLKVYFDNVMAHTGGPLGSIAPGNLFPDIPGFVPEDFHLVRHEGGGWRKATDSVDWNDEWQVLNRNPFSWDIAHESPNTSFDPDGQSEGRDYPKWMGIRHPGQTQLYPDLDLTITRDFDNNPLHTFANKEPFEDVGYGPDNIGVGNGRFDFDDLDKDGQHDLGEMSEPFTDTGIDGTNPARRNSNWGYGDGIYNMGDPVEEDVNSMLIRALRWFIDEAHPDGFRLDAVKHVPDYFFGEQNDDNKDRSGAGYNGQGQVQFNITRGHTDWGNHRDSVFTNSLARDDLLLYGEHLGAPPSNVGYLAAGMRIANEDFLNKISGFNGIGGSLSGYDQPNYGTFGTTTQNAAYPLSHDNNYMSDLDRPAAHQYLLTREGLPIVYTDGYNQDGAPSYFPKPSRIPFLGQFGQNWVTGPLAVRRDFIRGSQIPKWQDNDFAAWEFRDKRENSGMSDADGTVLLVQMARNYIGGQSRDMSTTFPNGARLRNYSNHGGGFHITVENGRLRNDDGVAPVVPSGGIFAFSWDNPRLPRIWNGSDVRPITIFQGNTPAPMMAHVRIDGRDGDRDYDQTVMIPRVTDGKNLRFVARADGSAINILMKLNGGIDLNSQSGINHSDPAERDNPPPKDRFFESPAQDLFTGYESMQFVDRIAEKFAATNVSRNVIGSAGAETWEIVIGESPTSNNGSGLNTDRDNLVVTWVYHNPLDTSNNSTPQYVLTPGNAIELRVKVGYDDEIQQGWVYYTTDGSTYPEGSMGVGKGNTQVAPIRFYANGNPDGNRTPKWFSADLPSLPNGTVLRYKIGIQANNTSDQFPFSAYDIDLKRRMETIFEIENFDATNVVHFPHNDYGEMTTGLEEGFHVLRTKSFLSRNGRSSIFRTETQTFYYDTERPTAQILYPSENDQLGGAVYGAVALSDSSVTNVQFRIIHSNPARNIDWTDAYQVDTPSLLDNTSFTREWRFDYNDIPATGNAQILVRFREASSLADNFLSDEAGHFTTLTRSVTTGVPVNYRFGFPATDGETVGEGYVAKVLFDKALAAQLDEFTVLMNGISAEPASLAMVRNETANDDALAITLPNLYDGNGSKPHEIRVIHQRGGSTLSAIRNILAVPTALPDSDTDGLPDIWELIHGLEPNNPNGVHGGQGDFDRDGLSNLLEFLSKKNPLISSRSILTASETSDGNTLLEFEVFTDRRYRIWRGSDLNKLSPDPEYFTVPSDDPDYSILEPQNGPRQFYALEIALPE